MRLKIHGTTSHLAALRRAVTGPHGPGVPVVGVPVAVVRATGPRPLPARALAQRRPATRRSTG